MNAEITYTDETEFATPVKIQFTRRLRYKASPRSHPMNEVLAKTSVNPEHWYEAHGAYLIRFANKHVQDFHAAEDLMQITLAKALAAVDRFQRRASVRTWLTRILLNEIAEHWRRHLRATKTSASGDHAQASDELAFKNWKQLATAAGLGQSEMDQPEFWRAIERCLNELPERYAEVFRLRYCQAPLTAGGESKSLEEIAKILGISYSNLAVRLHRARYCMRVLLTEIGFANSIGHNGEF